MDSGNARFSVRVMLAVVLAVMGVLAATLPAGAQDVAWDTYDVTVAIREDGTIKVVEDIEVTFDGSFRQGHRSIPLERVGEITNVTVQTGEPGGALTPSSEMDGDAYDGDPGTHRVYEDDGRLKIDYGFEPTSGNDTRHIIISYDVSGVLRVYPENDPPRQEIRWTAISSEVTEVGPIDRASATITFPASVEGSEATRFDPQPTSSDAMSVTWQRSNMEEGDALQVLASFPAMTDATTPSWQEDADALDSRRELVPGLSMVAGVISLVGFGLLGAMIWRSGVKDPDVGLVADILPEPPDDLAPSLAGTLVDESFGNNEIMAMLIDAERRGWISFSEDPTAAKKDDDPKRFSISLQQPVDGTPAWAQPFLAGLFGKDAYVGKDVTFERLKEVAQKHKGKISSAADKALFDLGYFEEMPGDTRKRWYIRAFLALLAIAVILGLIALWGRQVSPWLIAVGVVSLVLFIAVVIMVTWSPRKTVEGAESAAKWKAFQRYLKDMEKEMPLEQQRALFDTYLPWALALGFDKASWAKWMEQDPTYRWGSRQYRPWDPTWQGAGMRGAHQSRPSSTGGGSGSSFDVQSMSDRGMAGMQSANISMFALLNSASGSLAAGSGSSGGGSGSASVGSSGGGGHSFS